MPGERELIIERGTTDLTSRSLHCVDWRVGCPRDLLAVAIRINAELVKAKAFTEKRR